MPGLSRVAYLNQAANITIQTLDPAFAGMTGLALFNIGIAASA